MINKLRSFSADYLAILKGELAGINLTRILDEEEFFNKQILDSAMPFFESTKIKEILEKIECIVDIGFGGGFPLVVLAYCFPEKRFIGFEAREKKVLAVRKIIERFKLKNVTVFHKRLEEIDFDVNTLITFKAVGDIEDYLSIINGEKSIYSLFYKGPNVSTNEKIDKISNWKFITQEKFEIPGTEERSILIYQKINVPRGTNTKKDLVKVSKFH